MEQSVAFLEISPGEVDDLNIEQSKMTMSTSTQSQEGPQQASGLDPQSWEVQSMDSLRSLIASKDSPLDLKILPKISQRHFIALLKTLYDMLPAHPDEREQEAYQQINSIGNLL